MPVWEELKRRNVFKVGVAYAIVAWLLAQVTSVVFPALQLPPWSVTFVIAVLIVGFPVALVLAWAYELTPAGIRKTRQVPLEESVTRGTGQKLSYLVMGLLVLAVAFLAVDNYILDDAARSGNESATGAVTPAESSSIGEPGQPGGLATSVAVLPFENLSPNADDAYFAAGLHEEVLNQLAKLKNLSVIARTTMRQYENTEKSAAQVAAELNVATVMEGSVRYANGRVRVTAQLIDGQRGVHLWSDTYERDFADVFAIESDIAVSVANAMAVEFSLAEQARIEDPSTRSPEAYALFLAALDSAQGGTREGATLAIERLARAVEIDPDFAAGWNLKASLHTYVTAFFPDDIDAHIALAEQAAQRALEIDPDLPEGHIPLAMIQANRGNWRLAAAELRATAALGPTDPLVGFQFIVGHIEQAHQGNLSNRERDPLNANAAWWVVSALDTLGDVEGSLQEYERGKELFDVWPLGHFSAFVTLLGSGDTQEALELARSEIANRVTAVALEHFATPSTVIGELRSLFAVAGSGDRQYIAVLAAHFGDPQLAFEALRDDIDQLPIRAHLMWRPVFREVRRQPDFKDFLRERDFVAYWREYGWPDLCSPLGSDDFECR